ncbi:hypothetical protein [Streptomyces abyssomicinicus]|uniref:hypothetical protein n=1 Tax=Streptomyces abyssomicinicus TaxID=574929 RepID=UPI0013E03AB4|nr:hypothetical protein [Streptomyces abyssomicinicus]
MIPAGKPLPYDDGGLIGAHLIRKLEPEQFVAALRVMISHAVEAGLEVPLPSKR